MSDQDLIEQSAGLIPVYCDAFGAFRKVNGVLRCVGFVLDGGVTLSLIVSLAGADQAQLETQRILRERPTKGLTIWNGMSLAH